MSANRDINELDPTFKEKVMKFFSHTHAAGYSIFLTEGYRSQKRQNELYAQGRSKPGNIVTWTLNSIHTQRKAIDIAFNGDELYPSDLNIWKEVGKIANVYGIDWGYDLWGKDLPHFQDNGEPLQDIELLNTYKMSDIDKQIIEAEISHKKVSFNGAESDEVKSLAAKQANEWRDLLTNK